MVVSPEAAGTVALLFGAEAFSCFFKISDGEGMREIYVGYSDISLTLDCRYSMYMQKRGIIEPWL